MDGWPDDTSRALIDAIAIADSDDSLPKSGEGHKWAPSSTLERVFRSGGGGVFRGVGWGSTLEDGC